MANLDALFIPAKPVNKTTNLGAAASTAAIELGPRRKFAISAHVNGTPGTAAAYHISFGQSPMAAADADDFFIPAGVVFQANMGKENTHVRIFNPNAGGIDIYIMPLGHA